MLIFPNTSATALALHPKSFGEMSRGGVTGATVCVMNCFFVFMLQASQLNWDLKKNCWKERHCLNHKDSMCCHIWNLSQALSSQTPSMSELLIGHMCVERPCGWQPYSGTLDYWLGHLVTWNRPLLGLNDVYHVWLSGYKCVTAHFHHGDLHTAVCCHISRCKLPILHSSFY